MKTLRNLHPLLFPLPSPLLSHVHRQIRKYSSCLCVRMCKCKQRCVGSLCPGVRDLLQWLMGFLCEAPRGAAHNRWARPQPRQACPSHEEKRKVGEGGEVGGENIPSSLSFTLSFLPSAHPSCFFPPKNKIYSFFYNHSHPSLHSPFSTGPCPLLNSGCGTSTCTLAHVHEGEKQISEKHTRKKKREKKRR